MKLELSGQIFEKKKLKYQVSSKSIKWESSFSIWTDGRTGENKETNSRFSQFFERA